MTLHFTFITYYVAQFIDNSLFTYHVKNNAHTQNITTKFDYTINSG